ncbi:MAG: DUF6268 family outer membrane beta-barrel protein [Candidatus Omnitrophica bacterium]|nr:DUF6268 family outer membrane beta-barrel protein [Candidatus Omnitrophota bacterium]
MRSKIVLCFLVSFAFVSGVQANTEENVSLRFMPAKAVDAQSGEIELIRTETEFSHKIKIKGSLPLRFALNSEYLSIENTTAVNLPAHLTAIGFDLETTLPFFNLKDTYFRLGLSPSFFSDDWNFRASAFRLPMRYLLIHKPNDKLTLVAGLAIYPDFKNKCWPILGFIYQPNARFSFNLIPKKPNITYALNEKIDLFAEGGLSFEEFEVTKDNLKNVVLSYQEMRLGTGMTYKINKFFKSSFLIGGAFNRRFQYRDSLGKVEIKDGLYSEFRIETEF